MSARTRIAAAGVVALFMLAPAPALGAADLAVTATAEPDSLPLGTAEVAEVVITVTNQGADPAANVGVTIGGWEPELAFVSATPTQGSFNPGNGLWSIGTVTPTTSQTLLLRFSDAQTGVATLQVQAATETAESGSANNSASAAISVVGLVPSPELLAFPSQTVGGIGPPKTLTLTNGAAIPVRVGSIQIAGADFVSFGDGCSGVELTPDTACQLSLGFSPTARGDSAGTLTVISSTAKVFPLSVALIGTGLLPVASPVDTRAPSLRLDGVPKTLAADRFRKGFSVKVTPSEPAAIDVSLAGRARAGALASAFDLQLFTRRLSLAGGARTVKVKPAARLLGRLRKKTKVRLLVTATDASGNESSASRTLTVRPSR